MALATAVVVVLSMTAVNWVFQVRLKTISLVEKRAHDTLSYVSRLLLLTHEYVLYAEERSVQQWWNQHGALVANLEQEQLDPVVVSPLAISEARALPALFQALIDVKPDDTGFSHRQATFLTDRILGSLQIIADSAERWKDLATQHHIDLMSKLRWAALFSPLVMLSILFVLSVLLWRRVLDPLRRIHKAVLAVAQGDLTVRCASPKNDELGDLSRTFDAMAVDLVTDLRREIAERKQIEKGLHESESRFRLLVENAPDAIFVQTQECFAYVNRAALQLFGTDSAADLIGMRVLERFHPDMRDGVQQRIDTLNKQRRSVPPCHEVCLRLDGTHVDVEASAVPMNYEGEDGALVFVRDISERLTAEEARLRLEEQIHQAPKVESVGRLAGGVAHDYNNMLSVIIGYAELALQKVDSSESLHEDLKEILGAAERSRDITRQLLAFARKQTIEPKVLDLNEVVEDTLKMLRQLLGENIDLVWLPKAGLWPVEIDPSQLDQILANLCVNARDAITDVGKMTIETDMISLDQGYCDDHLGFIPGDFVILAVSDNGCGMDEETMNLIFEPFFTTKQLGQGTGLGLATVYGIVKQSNGFINVYSEPGSGTTFKIYLPRKTGGVVEEQTTGCIEVVAGHGETVLVVEDEAAILKLTRKILAGLGYQVLATDSPRKALALAEGHPEPIALLITDVVLPEMNGRELAARLQAIHPHLKCLFMSGYTANVIAHHGVLDKDIQFIHKPFSRKDLSDKIARILTTQLPSEQS